MLPHVSDGARFGDVELRERDGCFDAVVLCVDYKHCDRVVRLRLVPDLGLLANVAQQRAWMTAPACKTTILVILYSGYYDIVALRRLEHCRHIVESHHR